MWWFVFSVWEPKSSPSYWLAVLLLSPALGFLISNCSPRVASPAPPCLPHPSPVLVVGGAFPLRVSSDPAHQTLPHEEETYRAGNLL